MQKPGWWLGIYVALAGLVLAEEAKPAFLAAQPIWPAGRETEKNLFVGFRAAFVAPQNGDATLRLTASTEYRAFINGEFLGQGPARGPHGFFRVDEWPLTARLHPGTNVVAIEVAGYNANSFAWLDQPSFLQAEVVAAGAVLAATAGAGFEAAVLPERVQKVQRYSFQRPFSEVYQLTPGFDRWRAEVSVPLVATQCAVQPRKALLPRRVPYPDFAVQAPVALVSSGTVETGVQVSKPWKDRSLTGIGPKLGGYPENELATIPSLELQTIRNRTNTPRNQPYAAQTALPLRAQEFHILDLGTNLTGFIGATITARSPTRLFFIFDEILDEHGEVNFRRLDCVNTIACTVQPGTLTFEAFEPYTLRYLKLLVLDGACAVSKLYLRELANPDATKARFTCSDERLNRIFAAARQTFRQNATDVFMDCPSRERAGWLCDSFFTARVAQDLCGDTRVEKNFIEAFLLPPRFPNLPEGMLPMCYPSDHDDGAFIPNWAMWFVVELEEYLERSGDRAMIDALRPRVLKLIEFFKPHLNADGLLEKLPRWVFVEWSAANQFTQDVNYPSNMLYTRVLDAAARLYDLPDLARQAAQMRATIRRQSFDGEFFVDNAIRTKGALCVTRNRTEVCQYFAFFFGIATPASHARLWQRLTHDFGPHRKTTKAFPEIHPANAFIGNQIRFELLSQAGRGQQILDEAAGYWLYMADRTGTLWEHDAPQASCNHGFASHAAHVCLRDVLGLYRVDTVQKKITLRFLDLKLTACAGSVPTADGDIALRWWKDGDQLAYHVTAPPSYEIEVQNLTGHACVRQ